MAADAGSEEEWGAAHPVPGHVAPGALAREARIDEVQARAAELAGVLNATAGALVDLVADALAEGLWKQWGVHSPAQWLAWKTGLSIGRAQMVVRIARRRHDLPAAAEALRSGTLSVDQVQLLAAHVPEGYDEAAVAQLSRVLPRYAWDPADQPPADDETPAEPKERRRGSFGWDDTAHGRLSACLPTDEAMTVEAALKAARAELRSRHEADHPGEQRPWFGDADALVELARSYLARGAVAHPGRDRFLVHAHLEQHPDGTPVLRSHLGPVLPDVLRRFLTCDCDVRPVWEVHGKALSVGRTERLVPDRARRIIEQRDGGCIVPGCGRTTQLDVHHVVHWEDGGRTDTSNLCCLCRKHHRQHHLGLLGITGDADTPDGLVVTDRWGRTMSRGPVPFAVEPDEPPEVVSADRGVPAAAYRPASGERLRASEVWFPPNPSRAGPAEQLTGCGGG